MSAPPPREIGWSALLVVPLSSWGREEGRERRCFQCCRIIFSNNCVNTSFNCICLKALNKCEDKWTTCGKQSVGGLLVLLRPADHWPHIHCLIIFTLEAPPLVMSDHRNRQLQGAGAFLKMLEILNRKYPKQILLLFTNYKLLKENKLQRFQQKTKVIQFNLRKPFANHFNDWFYVYVRGQIKLFLRPAFKILISSTHYHHCPGWWYYPVTPGNDN